MSPEVVSEATIKVLELVSFFKLIWALGIFFSLTIRQF